MNVIDKILNKITMYRLVVSVLGALIALTIFASFIGRYSSSPTSLVVSLLLIMTSAYIADRGCARLFHIPTNMESSLITALIIFLIVQPADSVMTGIALIVAGAVSSASKFLLSRNGKHIFNPAAFAAAVLSLTGLQATTWWVGSSFMWPFALMLGLTVVRKIRRFPLVIAFITATALLQAALFVHGHQPLVVNMKHALVASPLIFLATIMLTEPATMPPRRNQQLVFGILVAVLYVTGWRIGPLIIYPEVALLIGNIYAYAVSPKYKIGMRLKEIQQISDKVYDYVFQPDRQFAYISGQYMEWTLASVPYDGRGNRRTFTLASSPTEQEVHVGLKFYEPASAYKSVLADMQPGDVIYASQLAGNFTIKGHETQKLAFIAGGIGVTPFRSMIKYITDQKIRADVVLLYVVRDPHEFAYFKEFKQARPYGVTIVPVVTDERYNSDKFVTAKLSSELLARYIPDYADRRFYISGPNARVDVTRQYLRDLGVSNRSITVDHFSGY